MSRIVDCGVQNTECGYCKSGKNTSVSHGMLAECMTVEDYQDLIDLGWRRSGTYLYKPNLCKTCCPQITIRTPVHEFVPDKEQAALLRKLGTYLAAAEQASPQFNQKAGSKACSTGGPAATTQVASSHQKQQAEQGCRHPAVGVSASDGMQVDDSAPHSAEQDSDASRRKVEDAVSLCKLLSDTLSQAVNQLKSRGLIPDKLPETPVTFNVPHSALKSQSGRGKAHHEHSKVGSAHRHHHSNQSAGHGIDNMQTKDHLQHVGQSREQSAALPNEDCATEQVQLASPACFTLSAAARKLLGEPGNAGQGPQPDSKKKKRKRKPGLLLTGSQSHAPGSAAAGGLHIPNASESTCQQEGDGTAACTIAQQASQATTSVVSDPCRLATHLAAAMQQELLSREDAGTFVAGVCPRSEEATQRTTAASVASETSTTQSPRSWWPSLQQCSVTADKGYVNVQMALPAQLAQMVLQHISGSNHMNSRDGYKKDITTGGRHNNRKASLGDHAKHDHGNDVQQQHTHQTRQQDSSTTGTQTSVTGHCKDAEPGALTVTLKPSVFDQEEFQLYKRYQISQHGDKPEEVTKKGYMRFLVDTPFTHDDAPDMHNKGHTSKPEPDATDAPGSDDMKLTEDTDDDDDDDADDDEGSMDGATDDDEFEDADQPPSVLNETTAPGFKSVMVTSDMALTLASRSQPEGKQRAGRRQEAGDATATAAVEAQKGQAGSMNMDVDRREPSSALAATATASERGAGVDKANVDEEMQGGAASPCCYGSFHMQYRYNGKLVAVGVVDILPRSLSSVYLFWDPDYRHLALGKLTALYELLWVQQASRVYPGLQWYYMGYYIHTCHKMQYKSQYKPCDLLCPGTKLWVRFDDGVAGALAGRQPGSTPCLSTIPGAKIFKNHALSDVETWAGVKQIKPHLASSSDAQVRVDTLFMRGDALEPVQEQQQVGQDNENGTQSKPQQPLSSSTAAAASGHGLPAVSVQQDIVPSVQGAQLQRLLDDTTVHVQGMTLTLSQLRPYCSKQGFRSLCDGVQQWLQLVGSAAGSMTYCL